MRVLATFGGLALASTVVFLPAHAQTLMGYDPGFPSADEITGPPAACGYPTGPFLGFFRPLRRSPAQPRDSRAHPSVISRWINWAIPSG